MSYLRVEGEVLVCLETAKRLRGVEVYVGSMVGPGKLGMIVYLHKFAMYRYCVTFSYRVPLNTPGPIEPTYTSRGVWVAYLKPTALKGMQYYFSRS